MLFRSLAQQSAVTQWHAHAQTLVAGFTGRGNAAQAYLMPLLGRIAVIFRAAFATFNARAADAVGAVLTVNIPRRGTR